MPKCKLSKCIPYTVTSLIKYYTTVQLPLYKAMSVLKVPNNTEF